MPFLNESLIDALGQMFFYQEKARKAKEEK